MKKVLVLALALVCAHGAFAQGTVNFNNRVTTGTGAQGPIIAQIYGVDPANPELRKTGNTSAGNPAGSQTYGGALLAGTGYTVQLWGTGGVTTDASVLQLANNGTTTFRTGSGAGFITALANAAEIPNAPAGAGSRATLQLRVWDNQGGTITTWAAALARPDVAKGFSDLFTPAFDLGGGSVLPPNLIGLTSFNLTTVVPEPSTVAFALMGGLGLLALRRRK